MKKKNIPIFPMRFPLFFTDDFLDTTSTKELSISEDDKNIFVEAALPGVDIDDIEISYDKGVIHIRGEKKEEEKKKRYYKRASRYFSYSASLPTEIDESKEPQASYEKGIVKITFKRKRVRVAKKIKIKKR